MVELRGFEPLTFCMPSTGIVECTSDFAIWPLVSHPLTSAEVRLGAGWLLYSAAVQQHCHAVDATPCRSPVKPAHCERRGMVPAQGRAISRRASSTAADASPALARARSPSRASGTVLRRIESPVSP